MRVLLLAESPRVEILVEVARSLGLDADEARRRRRGDRGPVLYLSEVGRSAGIIQARASRHAMMYG